MASKFISGIIYTVMDDIIGPNPKVSILDNLSYDTKVMISIKVISVLSGETVIPHGLVIIPFPSLDMKGMIKYIEWHDEERRGGIARAAIISLFNSSDDAVFYKYIHNLEDPFGKVAQKIAVLEINKEDTDKFEQECITFHKELESLLTDLRDYETSTESSEAFPEEQAEVPIDEEYRFKIIVCGDPQVGKTSTVLRFTRKAFKRTYLPTIGVNISEKVIQIKNALVQLIIWDIAGQTKFEKIRTHFYERAEGIFLVLDLSRKNTYDSIPAWYYDIRNNMKKKMRFTGFLIGNKNDLVDKREITHEQAEELAKELGLRYFETSALTGDMVEEAFYQIAKTLLNVRSVGSLKRE